MWFWGQIPLVESSIAESEGFVPSCAEVQLRDEEACGSGALSVALTHAPQSNSDKIVPPH